MGPIDAIGEPLNEAADEDTKVEENRGYAFRLFASSKPSSGSAIVNTAKSKFQVSENVASCSTRAASDSVEPKVVLSSPSPSLTSNGAFPQRRGREHYFTSCSPKWSQIKSLFAASAVSGTWILTQSRKRFKGCELPWRVIHLVPPKPSKSRLNSDLEAVAKKSLPTYGTNGGEERGLKKGTKPNKKRRIAIRTKARQREEMELERARARKENDREEREKRTRRNREKKIKRRAREKAKKSQTSPVTNKDSASL